MISVTFPVGEIKVGILQRFFFFFQVEKIPIESSYRHRVHHTQLDVMDASCLLPSLLDINVPSVIHAFLRQVEVVAFGIVGAESGEGSVGRPPEHGNVRIFLFDACDGFFDVVNVDAKMMQPRHYPGFLPITVTPT